jgi:hypothetical protein
LLHNGSKIPRICVAASLALIWTRYLVCGAIWRGRISVGASLLCRDCAANLANRGQILHLSHSEVPTFLAPAAMLSLNAGVGENLFHSIAADISRRTGVRTIMPTGPTSTAPCVSDFELGRRNQPALYRILHRTGSQTSGAVSDSCWSISIDHIHSRYRAEVARSAGQGEP